MNRKRSDSFRGGFWQQMKLYIRDHSEAEFSHGACPECTKNLYAEIDELGRI